MCMSIIEAVFSFFSFRVISKPLEEKIRHAKVAGLVVLIYIFALIIRIPKIYYRSYYPDQTSKNESIYVNYICQMTWPGDLDRLVYGTVWALLYEIIPLFLIIGFNFTAFRKLKQQMKSIDLKSNARRLAILRKASKTFCLVVVLFFICTLPSAVYYITIRYLVVYDLEYATRHLKDISRAHNYLVKLTNLNSCLNPVIYAKVHTKVWKLIRTLYRRILEMKPTLMDKQRVVNDRKQLSYTTETSF